MQPRREQDIQRAVLQRLALVPDSYWFKVNTVGIKKPNGRYIPATTTGICDILGCWSGRFVGVEVKRPRGQLSPTQTLFAMRVEDAGGVAVVVHSVDDVEDMLLNFNRIFGPDENN